MNVTLQDVLDSREARARRQAGLIARYGGALVSFTVNMPGPVKLNADARYIFGRGLADIRAALRAAGMAAVHEEICEKSTGPEGFAALPPHASAREVKWLMIALEDRPGLPRLYDIDILGPDGARVSRAELGLGGRRCLLCGREAIVCIRGEAHSTEALLDEVARLTDEDRREMRTE